MSRSGDGFITAGGAALAVDHIVSIRPAGPGVIIRMIDGTDVTASRGSENPITVNEILAAVAAARR